MQDWRGRWGGFPRTWRTGSEHGGEINLGHREGASLLNEGEKEVRMRPHKGMGLSRETRGWGN